MKLAIVSTVPLTLYSFFSPYAKYFRAAGWEVVGLAAEVNKDRIRLGEFNSLVDIPWGRKALSFGNIRAFFSVRKSLKTNDFDLVHVHTPIAALITRLAFSTLKGKIKTKIIYTAHGFHFHQSGKRDGIASHIYHIVEKLATRWTHVLIVINQEDHQVAIKLTKGSQCDVEYIKGVGLDLQQYSSCKNPDQRESDEIVRLRRELGLDDSEKLILVVGELNDNKRPQDSIKAFQGLRSDNVKLCFVGDGYLRKKLEDQVASLGLESKIAFLGYRSDVPELLAAADILVLASDREGLPRSIMEAMASGLPVVATDIRGNRDLLEGNAGVLVEPRSPDQLSEAIDCIFSDEKFSLGVVTAALTKISDYDIASILDQHNAIYEKCLGESRYE